jgi:Uma2 family endonuclease
MGLPLTKMSLDEFLEWERSQLERHEFWRGEVFATTGGTARHNRVILNLAARLSGKRWPGVRAKFLRRA